MASTRVERHFICEFITAGGMRDRPLPTTLCAEGLMMRDALFRELSTVPERHLVTSVDDRVPAPRACGDIQRVATEQEAWQCWAGQLSAVDYFWPVAPESAGLAYCLARLTENCRARVPGSRADAIALCANKWRLYLGLCKAGLPCIPTCRLGEAVCGGAERTAGWVVKPVWGTGCEDCLLCSDWDAVQAVGCSADARARIVQPWVSGDTLSLSTLMCDGQVLVLSCNRQLLVVDPQGRLVLRGVVVNVMPPDAEQRALAGAVARLFPGLFGFVGIDCVLAADGLRIVEINPRLTSVFAGVSSILKRPVALLLQELLHTRSLPTLQRSDEVVEVVFPTAA